MDDLDLLFDTPLAEVEEYRFSVIDKGIYNFIVEDITTEDGSSENKQTGEEEDYRRIDFVCKIIEVITCKGKDPNENLEKVLRKSFFIRKTADPKKSGMGVLKAFLTDMSGAKLDSSISTVLPLMLNRVFRGEVTHRKSNDAIYAGIKPSSISPVEM